MTKMRSTSIAEVLAQLPEPLEEVVSAFEIKTSTAYPLKSGLAQVATTVFYKDS